MTGFSTLPLQIASLAGFVVMLFGTLVLAWVLANYVIYGRVAPGFAFLASITTIFSGAQLFALGIFGEYLARIHFRTMDRPPYVIDGVVNMGRQTVDQDIPSAKEDIRV
jgi:undecaprenyl-phosphate 4-deoxy-4-formamido-L-arabinose transferase